MEGLCSPSSGRLDRTVARTYIRAARDLPLTRLQFSLEQALRLAVLAGEEEGRIYCFRRVHFAALSAQAHRQQWIEQVQTALDALAARAIHGAMAGAQQAEAVYFHNIEEALQILLRKALTAGIGQSPDWFAASLLGDVDARSWKTLIPAIVERIFDGVRSGPTSAAMVISVLETTGSVPLLSAVPEGTLRRWVGPVKDRSASGAVALRLPSRLRELVEESLRVFGPQHPATVWLCAQAVILIAPATWSSGAAAGCSVAIVARLDQERRAERDERQETAAHPQHRNAIVFSDRNGNASVSPMLVRDNASTAEISAQDGLQPAALVQVASESLEPSDVSRVTRTSCAITQSLPLGDWSKAGGLLFFLNVLRTLGMDRVTQACPALVEQDFCARILRELARHARVAQDDALLACVPDPREPLVLESAASISSFPDGWTCRAERAPGGEYLTRAWVVAAKRCCRRNTHMSPSTLVCRLGRVWRTRTETDVTFALDQADVRIRLAGLDIDPGWVPWLGRNGCVVRFHYRDREVG